MVTGRRDGSLRRHFTTSFGRNGHAWPARSSPPFPRLRLHYNPIFHHVEERIKRTILLHSSIVSSSSSSSSSSRRPSFFIGLRVGLSKLRNTPVTILPNIFSPLLSPSTPFFPPKENYRIPITIVDRISFFSTNIRARNGNEIASGKSTRVSTWSIITPPIATQVQACVHFFSFTFYPSLIVRAAPVGTSVFLVPAICSRGITLGPIISATRHRPVRASIHLQRRAEHPFPEGCGILLARVLQRPPRDEKKGAPHRKHLGIVP